MNQRLTSAEKTIRRHFPLQRGPVGGDDEAPIVLNALLHTAAEGISAKGQTTSDRVTN